MQQVCNPYELIIQGITHKGRTFRPSDWSERLSGILSSFNTGRLAYHDYVRPLLLDEVRCVAVDKKLETLNPSMFQFLMDFAHDNDLRVIDCKTMLEEQANQAPLQNDAADTAPGAPESVPHVQHTAPKILAQETADNAASEASLPAPIVCRALANAEIASAHQALASQSPTINNAKAFEAYVNTVTASEGYRLMGALQEDRVLAACGYRIKTTLAQGKIMQIENLGAVSGQEQVLLHLLDGLKQEAQREGASALVVEAAAQPESAPWHRLYFEAGYALSAYQFMVKI